MRMCPFDRLPVCPDMPSHCTCFLPLTFDFAALPIFFLFCKQSQGSNAFLSSYYTTFSNLIFLSVNANSSYWLIFHVEEIKNTKV
jgi:hypothetical protein